jgi:hypothetical protein
VAAVCIALLYGSLLAPGALLAFRDFPFFHLPLRSTLASLVAGGELPLWNPFLNGGQPILSNPNYAAFYPPTWLAFVLAPAVALQVGLVLHALLGSLGAASLVRRLGVSSPVAALAIVAWAAGGVTVSNASTYTFFCALAWWPWCVRWALDLWAGPRWQRPAVALGAGLALQLLAGEPVVVLLTALTAAALALASRWQTAPGLGVALGRLLVAGGLAALLAAVQLLPAVHRVADSERTSETFHSESLGWSAPPQRLAEIFLPRIYGDPMRLEENLYFGWSVHDRSFPYVPSLYPGLLLALLGVVTLARGGIPWRAGWLVISGGMLFVALGRHNPLLAAVWEHLPVFAWIRFPEKFLVPAVLSLAIAGILGWHQLVQRRGAADRRRAGLPLLVATVWLAAVAALALAVHTFPALGRAFVLGLGPPTPWAPEAMASAMDFLRRESLLAVVVAAAVAGLLALVRWSTLSPRALTLAATLLLALDLSTYGHRFLRAGAAEDFLEPPSSLAALASRSARVFSDVELHRDPEIHFRSDAEAGFRHLRLRIDRGDPYLGTVWGLRYVGNGDYDRMLTPWARHTVQTLAEDWWQNRDLAYRFLGAWGVEGVLLRRSAEELVAARRADPAALPMVVGSNPYRVAPVRSVPRVAFHADLAAARDAAREASYPFPWQDHFVVTGEPPAGVYAGAPADLLRFAEHPGRVEVHVAGNTALAVVVASTFDPGWEGTLIGSDTRPVGEVIPLYPTAAGQLGFLLPAGEHRITLRYRQPGLRSGSLLSLGGFTLALGLWWRGRRAL